MAVDAMQEDKLCFCIDVLPCINILWDVRCIGGHMQRKGAGPGCRKGTMDKKDTWKINRQTVNTVTFGKSVRKAADCQNAII